MIKKKNSSLKEKGLKKKKIRENEGANFLVYSHPILNIFKRIYINQAKNIFGSKKYLF